MKTDNDKWIEILKRKTDQVPVSLDTDRSWMRMEQKIRDFYRIRLLRRVGLAAAGVAAILVAVLFLNIAENGSPEQTVRIVTLHQPATDLICKAERPLKAMYIDARSRVRSLTEQPAVYPESAPAHTPAPAPAKEAVQESAQEQVPVTVAEAEATPGDPFLQPGERPKNRNKFMVSAAGLLNVSRGGAEGALPINDLLMSDNRLTTLGLAQKDDRTNTCNASFTSVSYVQYEYKHRMPVSFGMYVSLPLSERWFLESGLFATRLATAIYSKSYMGIRPDNIEPVFVTDRVLWYLGVPLKIRWNFVQKRFFTAYASAGGMLEKCISFNYTGDMVDENMQFTTSQIPLQWSVNATLGAQYNIISKLGLFVEPGVSFFFDSHNPIPTIREERPLYFNLNAGIRFTF